MVTVKNRNKQIITISVIICIYLLLSVLLCPLLDKIRAQSVIPSREIENDGQMAHCFKNKLSEELKTKGTQFSNLSFQNIEIIQAGAQNINSADTLFSDLRDGKRYRVVRIGNQLWMAENLNYNIIDSRHPKKLINFCYEYKNENCEIYGRLYNWEVALKVCPPGWHLPTDEEWSALVNYLDGRDVAGGKMKETGTTHWVLSNPEATNESGFTALPGGSRFTIDKYTGVFTDIGISGSWWSSTENSKSEAWSRHLSFNFSIVNRIISHKVDCFSVRCLKDD